jgi:hypothetical protein
VAAILTLPKKSIFDFDVNFVQPLLGSFGSLPIGLRFSFQLRNPILSRAQLMRKLLSHFQRVSAVVFGSVGRFMK